jgi:hypothetical protein
MLVIGKDSGVFKDKKIKIQINGRELITGKSLEENLVQWETKSPFSRTIT